MLFLAFKPCKIKLATPRLTALCAAHRFPTTPARCGSREVKGVAKKDKKRDKNGNNKHDANNSQNSEFFI